MRRVDVPTDFAALFSLQSGGAPLGRRAINMSTRDMSQLLDGMNPIQNLFEDGDEDDDDDYYGEDNGAQQWFPPHDEPQPAGVDLLASGDFGRVSVKKDRTGINNRNVAKRMFTRVLHPQTSLYKENITSVSCCQSMSSQWIEHMTGFGT
jgi:WD repeat-containing protein 23